MKNVFVLAAAGIAALSIPYAAYADSQAAFLQANVGHTNTDARNSTAYGVLGGYRWAVDEPFYLGVEGGYVNLDRAHFRDDSTISFTDPTGPHTLTSHSRGKSTNEALLLGVNGKWELPGQYFITAHAGLARYRDDIRVHASGTLDGVATEGFSDRYRYYDTSYYAGLGFGYDFNRQVSLSFNYDHYEPRYEEFGIKETVKFDTYGMGVEFRF
jgi:hypothetical protein